MTTSEILWLAAGAVLVFWLLGAYNRVMALRGRIVQAWPPIHEPLQRRRESLGALITSLRPDWPDDAGAFDGVLAALGETSGAADAVARRPAAAAACASLAEAEQRLQAPWQQLRGQSEALPALVQREEVAVTLLELRGLEDRRAFARLTFNEAAAAYDAAINQWPTRIVARIFGFEPAGRL